MIKILLSGANGKMGQMLSACIARDENAVVVAGVDKMPDAVANAFPVYGDFHHVLEAPDVIIDFSRPDALLPLLSYAEEKKAAVVLCTTGFTPADKEKIADAAQRIPIFYSANMSLGVNLQMVLAKKAAEFLGGQFDIEIIEKHHNQKVDAPSGTALAIADYVNDAFDGEKKYVYGRTPEEHRKRDSSEIGIHAVRGGTVVGEHDVLFFGNDEVIEIRHSALSRHIFAEGAIRAAKFLAGKAPGLYSMFDIITDSSTVMNLYTRQNKAVVRIAGSQDSLSLIADLFNALAASHVEPEMINECGRTHERTEIVFCISERDLKKVNTVLAAFPALEVEIAKNLTTLTLEGAGLEKLSGTSAKMLSILASEEIKTHIFRSSHTKISICIDSEDMTKAVKAITEMFKL
ncbi:MAG: 4-hydroxy-tetrahydrodipicolinate reductase [Christensenella sp.]|nr:4-hydroxy-tetrahydrodipicolinate reductase [Christensenella sp.]